MKKQPFSEALYRLRRERAFKEKKRRRDPFFSYYNKDTSGRGKGNGSVLTGQKQAWPHPDGFWKKYSKNMIKTFDTKGVFV